MIDTLRDVAIAQVGPWPFIGAAAVLAVWAAWAMHHSITEGLGIAATFGAALLLAGAGGFALAGLPEAKRQCEEYKAEARPRLGSTERWTPGEPIRLNPTTKAEFEFNQHHCADLVGPLGI